MDSKLLSPIKQLDQSFADDSYESSFMTDLDASVAFGDDESDELAPMLEAARDGKLAEVQRLFKSEGKEDEQKSGRGRTALMFAVRNGHRDVASFLITEAKSDMNAVDEDGSSAMHCAAHMADPKMLALLLDAGKGVDRATKDGVTPLIEAIASAEKGETSALQETVQLLVSKGANVQAEDVDGRTALCWASINNCNASATILIKARADVEHRTKQAWNPLLLAADCGHADVVNTLVEHKVNVNAALKSSGRTALMLAAPHGAEVNGTRIVSTLLKAGADPNTKDLTGWTALTIASARGLEQLVRLLLVNKADPNATRSPFDALECAIQSRQTAVVNLLLRHGADANVTNDQKKTPLFLSALLGLEDAVRLLLVAGANPAARNGEQQLQAWEVVPDHMINLSQVLQAAASESQEPETPEKAAAALAAQYGAIGKQDGSNERLLVCYLHPDTTARLICSVPTCRRPICISCATERPSVVAKKSAAKSGAYTPLNIETGYWCPVCLERNSQGCCCTML